MKIYFTQIKNPYFKNGDNRPLFYNRQYAKANPTLTAAQVMEHGATTFFNRYFKNTIPITSHQVIFRESKYMTIRISKAISGSGNIPYVCIDFDDADVNILQPKRQYWWVVDVRYPQTGTLELDLEIDIWTTYQTLISFESDNSVEVERRMPKCWILDQQSQRYYPDLRGYLPAGNDVDLVGDNPIADMLWTDPLPHDIKLISDRAIQRQNIVQKQQGTPCNIDFFGFHKRRGSIAGTTTTTITRAYFYYALISPTAGGTDAIQINQYEGSGNAKILPTGAFVVPLACDDYAGDRVGDSTDPNFRVFGQNRYKDIAKLPNNILQGIYISTIPPYNEGDEALPVDVNKMRAPIAQLGVSGDLNSVRGFGSLDPRGENGFIASSVNPFGVGTTIKMPTKNEQNNDILRPVERLGIPKTDPKTHKMLYKRQEDPLLSMGTFTEFKIITFTDSSAALTPELLFNRKNNKINLDIQQSFNINNGVLLYLFTPAQVAHIPEFTFSKTYDGTLPSGASAWVNFMAQHKASYTTSLLQNGFSGMASTIGGFISGGASGGVSAATGSISTLASKMAQQKDLQRQPIAVHNNISKNTLLAMDYLLKHDDIDGKPIPSQYMSGFIARLGLPQDIEQETLKHYRLYGNPIKEIKTISWEIIHSNALWSYWQIMDITNAIAYSTIPNFAMDELRNLFNGGVRLWAVYDDGEYCNQYNKYLNLECELINA